MAKNLEVPETVTEDQLNELRQQVDELTELLEEGESERAELKRQVTELAKLRPEKKVATVMLPKDEKDRFEALVTVASKALRNVSRPVREAIRCQYAVGEPMPWPERFNDAGWFDDVKASFDGGELVEYGSDEQLLVADLDYVDADEAREAVQALVSFVEKEAEGELYDWFKSEYRLPLDLGKERTRKALFN